MERCPNLQTEIAFLPQMISGASTDGSMFLGEIFTKAENLKKKTKHSRVKILKIRLNKKQKSL